MRERILTALAYTGAALTLLAAVLVPFVLYGAFTAAVAHAGLHIDAGYTGGAVVRSIDRGAWRILVSRPVEPVALQRIEPFVQVVFEPANRLPARIDEQIDLDGDGKPDIRAVFAVPADPRAPLHGNVIALNGKFQPLNGVGGDSFSRLLVRAGSRIVLRVPLAPKFAAR